MPQKDVSRRDVVKMAGAATAATAAARRLNAAPRIQKVHAAGNQVSFAVIGTGGRGRYHIDHANKIDSGRCVAVCDIVEENLKKGIDGSRDKPQGYKDYRELLANKDVEAVLIATPLYAHFGITRDALLAGKHVFCEKSLVFKPEEVHALRALANERSKQILQTGLQRRYSEFYQTAKAMIDKGMIGKVTHVYAQWHRSGGWKMNKDKPREQNWRLFREFSGGLTAELASHQIDIADWMFGSHPEFVTGVGGIDFVNDGRDVFDNIQLIFRYPKGEKLMYSSISTNKHLALFGSQRNEFGEMIMGTEGTIHITVGTDNEPALGMWFFEPTAKPEEAKKESKAVVASATLTSTGRGARGFPILLPQDQISDQDSFLSRELKFAKRWLYSKGVMVPEETRNPVDIQLEAFFDACRTGTRPKADLEVGLADSTAVMLANLAMDEGRRVYFKEIESMGRGGDAKAKKG